MQMNAHQRYETPAPRAPAIATGRPRHNRVPHQRFNRLARYSLLISTETPALERDLYVQVSQEIVSPAAAPPVVAHITLAAS